MDIQAASNFERYLYFLLDKDPVLTAEAMLKFAVDGRLDLSGYSDHIKRDFGAVAVSEEEVMATIEEFKQNHDYLLDPHTAIGVFAGQQNQQKNIPMICLATAHPAKFGDTVKAACGVEPILPEAIKDIFDKESRCELMPADKGSIMAYLKTNAIRKIND